MKTNDIYQIITDKMIAQLEAGIIPWQKPWQNAEGAGCISHANGKPYSILNQMLLGFRAGEWLTYKQVVAEGGKVRKGEKASFVVFWSFIEKTELEAVCDEHGDEIGTRKVLVDRYPVLKSYNLFHIDQCEGVAPKFANEPVKNEHTANEVAEAVIAEYAKRDALTLNVCESNQAFYSPSKDFVQVPQMSQYANEAEYYSTMFHELTHSTGHERRLNRKEVNTLHFFGDDDYSREELTAEMGAAFLCSQVGIDCAKAFKNSAAYIQGWLNHLRGDNKAIVIAAGKAERAAKYILTGEK